MSFESLESQILTYLSYQSQPSMQGAPMTNPISTKVKKNSREKAHNAQYYLNTIGGDHDEDVIDDIIAGKKYDNLKNHS